MPIGLRRKVEDNQAQYQLGATRSTGLLEEVRQSLGRRLLRDRIHERQGFILIISKEQMKNSRRLNKVIGEETSEETIEIQHDSHDEAKEERMLVTNLEGFTDKLKRQLDEEKSVDAQSIDRSIERALRNWTSQMADEFPLDTNIPEERAQIPEDRDPEGEHETLDDDDDDGGMLGHDHRVTEDLVHRNHVNLGVLMLCQR